MKKTLITLCAVMAISFIGIGSAKADDDKPIAAENLPASIKTFISTHFPDTKVAYAKTENDDMKKSYEVVLTNSVKLEFNKKGEWKNVDCERGAVPQAIVPEQIRAKVNELYPQAVITSIDRDRHDYEVELNNDIDLKFNLQFQLLEID